MRCHSHGYHVNVIRFSICTMCDQVTRTAIGMTPICMDCIDALDHMPEPQED